MDPNNEYMQDCACGSGKKAGNCCRAGEDCPCGSGKPVGECCMKSPETHEDAM